ncbi:MAG: small multi-drug export protein [Kiritimatiellae bacterium]|nr:small multi-drug export protein [Kiritimatiellia bacterium]
MLRAIAILVATTLIPGLELRASIPLGFFSDGIRGALGLPVVVAVCLATNVALGMLAYEAMAVAEGLMLRIGWFRRHVWPILVRRRESLRAQVEKYGIWGVSVFIGIPLPGTGAYAGAAASWLLHLDRRRFWIANALGVLAAAAAVTLICIALDSGFIAEDSFARRLFIK